MAPPRLVPPATAYAAPAPPAYLVPPAPAYPAPAAPRTEPQTGPQTGPQATPPQPGPGRAVSPGKRGAVSHRMPFVLLLCALLGGALVCTMVISTTLAEGAFQITGLQQSNSALARQQQALQEQVAQEQSAQVIESEALKLGMRPQGELRFLDLKTGNITTDQGSGAVSAINVPGYTP